MTGKRLIISALVLALVQIGFLSWIIAGRAAILRDGKQVLLRVEPIDPRDLLRGDYIRLGYEISRIPVKLIANIPAGKLTSDDTPIVVRLKQGADGYWGATAAWFGQAPAPAASDEVDIVGHVSEGWDFSAATIDRAGLRHRTLLSAGRRGDGDPERHAGAAVRRPRRNRSRWRRADQGADGRRQDAVRGTALLELARIGIGKAWPARTASNMTIFVTHERYMDEGRTRLPLPRWRCWR